MNNKFHKYSQPIIDNSAVLNDLAKNGRKVPLSPNPGFLTNLLLLAFLAGILVACGSFYLLTDGLLVLQFKTYASALAMIAFKLASNIIGFGCTLLSGVHHLFMQVNDQALIQQIIEGVLPYLHHPVFIALLALTISGIAACAFRKRIIRALAAPRDSDPSHINHYLWGLWFACIGFWKYLLFPFINDSLWFVGSNPGGLNLIILLLSDQYPPFSNERFRTRVANTALKISNEKKVNTKKSLKKSLKKGKK